MPKEIYLGENWSLIKCRNRYMLSEGNRVFIHGDKIRINPYSGWLNILNQDGTYIGSIWIDSLEVIKKVKELMEE